MCVTEIEYAASKIIEVHAYKHIHAHIQMKMGRKHVFVRTMDSPSLAAAAAAALRVCILRSFGASVRVFHLPLKHPRRNQHTNEAH